MDLQDNIETFNKTAPFQLICGANVVLRMGIMVHTSRTKSVFVVVNDHLLSKEKAMLGELGLEAS